MRTRWSRTIAGAAAVTLLAAACGDGGDDAGQGDAATDDGDGGGDAATGDYCTTAGGVLRWTHEQEPENMHGDDPANNKAITSWIRASLWEGLYGIASDISYEPELLAEPLEVTDNGDGTFTYSGSLREGLVWSDGTPLTTEHVQGTYDLLMEGVDEDGAGGTYLIGSRIGYTDITSFDVESETAFSWTSEGFFAGFESLFGEIFPTHVVPDAATANEVFPAFTVDGTQGGEPLPSAGPMIWDSYDQGLDLTLTRNDDYHGSTSKDATNDGVACVEGVEIVFAADTDAQVNALRAGEADLIFAQPQTAFLELANSPDFEVGSTAGPTYEHWSFNLVNEHLADPAVREAIAYGIDKAEVVRTLYAPLFGDLLPEAGLGQTYWMTNQSPYVDYQEDYAGAQVDEARASLEGAGYTLDGEVYTHPDRGRLSLRVGTTGGNALREQQQQLIQAQLEKAGIEITIDNVQGSAYFTERPFADASVACYTESGEGADCNLWDIAQFAFVGGPWPGSGHSAYTDNGGNNIYSFEDPAFDDRVAECDQVVDFDERADCYNELAEWSATLERNAEQGLVVVPLTQKPNFFAFSTVNLASGAVSPDMIGTGPLANVVDYVVAG